MNQMMPFSTVEMDDGPRQDAPPSGPIVVKRLGLRPLAFEGVELCMAMSYVPGAPMWYEINVYRTVAQGFVFCVKHFHRDENEHDICRAWECGDFETVMSTLEGYDPASDLRVGAIEPDPDMALPDLVALAFSLRAKAAEARRQYRALVGEILHDLDEG